jgi:hypothetical protein
MFSMARNPILRAIRQLSESWIFSKWLGESDSSPSKTFDQTL